MRILLLLLSTLLVSCSLKKDNLPPVKTQQPIDLKKYSGSWYEIASFPNFFQKGCMCTKALYKQEKNYIRVINSCYKNSLKNKLSIAEGKAFIVPNSQNSKLKVQFFWPFKGDYWILYVSADYTSALVGNPKRNYLWILSRTPTLPQEQILKMKNIAKNQGYDISKLNSTFQSCKKI
jgi:apolipoprotein D and lipocalin family protein